MFKVGDKLLHIKHNNHYVVVKEPDERRLEICNEPFYEYQALYGERITWLRSKSKMEDGRFIKVD